MNLQNNNAQIRCTLFFDRNRTFIPHFYQAISGFKILEKHNIISLDVKFVNNEFPFDNIFCCTINGKKVFYDLSDGTQNCEFCEYQNFLHEQNSILFKRAYDESLYKNESLIFPYGLNYIGLYPIGLDLIRNIFLKFPKVLDQIYNHFFLIVLIYSTQKIIGQ